MERELVELFEAAKKAADAAAAVSGGPADESRCLDALKRLKDFPVNFQILVSTQVGKSLKHLTKHPRKKIQSFAAELIEIWKNIIIEETAHKKNGTSGGSCSAKPEPANVERCKKTIPVKSEKASRGEIVKSEDGVSPRVRKVHKTDADVAERKFENGDSVKRQSSGSAETVKVERVLKQEKAVSLVKSAANDRPKLTSLIKCNDVMRDKFRENLFNALSRVFAEADDDINDEVNACDPIRVAVSVESALFEKWGPFNGTHKFKYRSVLNNIKDDNNPDFRRKVLLGLIKPERIVHLTPSELASDQRRLEDKQIAEKKLFDCERGGPPKATTDQFKCGRCGQRKCTYYQLQTRSADEPMTTFVTCVNCNNHWKFC